MLINSECHSKLTVEADDVKNPSTYNRIDAQADVHFWQTKYVMSTT